MKSILFICMGNICRSPTAEDMFRKLVSDARLTSEFSIDSAGTTGGMAEGMAEGCMRDRHSRERMRNPAAAKLILTHITIKTSGY